VQTHIDYVSNPQRNLIFIPIQICVTSVATSEVELPVNRWAGLCFQFIPLNAMTSRQSCLAS